MIDSKFKKSAINYSVIGFTAGIFLALIAMMLDLAGRGISLTFEHILLLYGDNTTHVIFLILPFIIFGFTYFITLRIFTVSFSLQNQLNNLKIHMDKIHTFVVQLINQDTNAEYTIEDENDKVGASLIELRDNLNKNQDEVQKRRKEDDQRNWIAEGLAKFGEILRKNNDDLEVLSYNIISNLVNYVNANQGGFFIINDEDENDKHFEMTACYAYERKKFADKRLEWGEGLIGTCAMERETIYMTKLPESYVHITSGLGKSTPRALLIVPLKVNEEIHGVLEIASFKELEKYQVEFVEKVAESIASTISTVKTNVQTAKLLKESQEQAEILATQEEEMRQNMEELQATQEEAARQSEKFVSFTNSVNHTLIRAEYNTNGTLLYANTKFLKKLGYSSNSEVEGKHISMFINNKDRVWFDPIWDTLAKGGKHFEGDMKHVTKQDQDLWTMATYTCVRNEDGTVDKILFLAIDTTEQKKQSLDYEGQINALNQANIKAEFLPEGEFLEANEQFYKIFKYKPAELKEATLFDLTPKEDIQIIEDILKKIATGEPFQGQFRGITKDIKEKWFRVTLSAVNDMYGDVAKLIYLAQDVTHEKLMEIESQKQNEQLKIHEEKLRRSGEELSQKLAEAKKEMQLQFKEIEDAKIRNERTLEGALDAIITINQAGTIEFFNKAAENLWSIPRKDAIGQNVRALFSEEQIRDDDFVARYTKPDEDKIIGERKEVQIRNNNGDDVPVLFLLSEAKVGNEHTYTAFIQNIEVELF